MDFECVEVPCEGVELVSKSDPLLGEIDAFHDFDHGVVRIEGVGALR
jgi:hypothetical protein